MAKHRRYSRKRRSQRRRRNYSTKMRGGVDTSSSIDFETAIPPGQNSPDTSFIDDQPLDMSDLEAPPLTIDDLHVTTDSQEGITTSETISPTDNLYGGRKRRYKRRSTLAMRTKRKTKKTKKTRKIRKRQYYGGEGFTTQVTTNPIAYKKKEYYEMMELIDKSRQ